MYSIDDTEDMAFEPDEDEESFEEGPLESFDDEDSEVFEEGEESTEEDTSIDYSLAYDRTKARYLKEIEGYKEEKEFAEPELSKFRELLKKYKDEKTHKDDFFNALDNFKKEVDELKTKTQHTKEKKSKIKKSTGNFFFKVFSVILAGLIYLGQFLWWLIKILAKVLWFIIKYLGIALWWILKGVGYVILFILMFIWEFIKGIFSAF